MSHGKIRTPGEIYRLNYRQYYNKCKENYQSSKNVDIYRDTVKVFNLGHFSKQYYDCCLELSDLIEQDFNENKSCSNDGIMITHSDIWKFKKQIDILCNDIVPYLEENTYGCNLYVDKIYIYRTLNKGIRESSYLWHYDNNPNEIIKNLVYLDDVSVDNSPFQYLEDETGNGFLGECTHLGPNHWMPPPNRSRYKDEQIENKVSNKGFVARKVLGSLGTTVSFNNNVVHRANPVVAGKRDVINIRVKPTLSKPVTPADPRWTTSYEKSGAVNPDPTLDWTV